jgi:hypothetical protein
MLSRHTAFLLFLILCLCASVAAQQPPPQRNPRAVAVLQQSLAAMGGAAPADSVATGTITLVEGSTTETGTIRILLRGLDQSREEMLLPEGRRTSVRSRDRAAEFKDQAGDQLPIELVVTSQSTASPLVLVTAALQSPDTALEYVVSETLDGDQCFHLRWWETFPSKPKRKPLEAFTVRDLWIDASTGLPKKLSYERRAARGSDAIQFDVSYGDYRNVGGTLFPFLIERATNGTPWATIRLTQIEVNKGLADADFAVEGMMP